MDLVFIQNFEQVLSWWDRIYRVRVDTANSGHWFNDFGHTNVGVRKFSNRLENIEE